MGETEVVELQTENLAQEKQGERPWRLDDLRGAGVLKLGVNPRRRRGARVR